LPPRAERLRGLEEKQAVIGIVAIDAPTVGAAREGRMIGRGIVAAQRDLEALLTGGGSVASTAVAAGLGEDRHDVVGEADGLLGTGNRGNEQGAGDDEGRERTAGHAVPLKAGGTVGQRSGPSGSTTTGRMLGL
jgi:hypothetical protein